MRYVVKFHEVSGEWLVFDVSEGLEVVGMHAYENDAVYQAMKLEEKSRRQARWNICPLPEAA